tara:strand:+ start:116 stop:271 length:156 start_codon:yes stop_codon:yes gene_type:complete
MQGVMKLQVQQVQPMQQEAEVVLLLLEQMVLVVVAVEMEELVLPLHFLVQM